MPAANENADLLCSKAIGRLISAITLPGRADWHLAVAGMGWSPRLVRHVINAAVLVHSAIRRINLRQCQSTRHSF